MHEHDYIQVYESASEALKRTPEDLNLQHKVVLSLARAGALEFAISEYRRFGLTEVQGHEDVMALNGRLSKDLYLQSSGDVALSHAKEAAHKYDVAFQYTRGYYSGINSATMSMIAGLPVAAIAQRVLAIESILPESKKLDPTEHYFIEATRAECHLLRDDLPAAKKSLQAAIDFDPLNYAAHATTLKQFKMILGKRGAASDWLSHFSPPRPMHFAGHIKIDPSEASQEKLRVQVADALQKNDIGFGYGALAAGCDIVIAEALLAEGGELNVVLPCAEEVFLEESVRPFGETWVKRYYDCVAQSKSIKVLGSGTSAPNPMINRLAGQIAMGQTKLWAASLCVDPVQLLVLNAAKEKSLTATHGSDWQLTACRQILLSTNSSTPTHLTPSSNIGIYNFVLLQGETNKALSFETASAAISKAVQMLTGSPKLQIALHVDLPGRDTFQILNKILIGGAPQSLLVSEEFASVLAFANGGDYEITYAGRIENDGSYPLRCYVVHAR